MRCPICRLGWPAGATPACPCLDDATPACPCLDDDTPSANEPSVVVVRELPPLGELVVVGLVCAWGLLWAVWWGVRGVLRLVGVGP